MLQATGARATVDTHIVQGLWTGWGQIVRCHLEGAAQPSVIVEHVRWTDVHSASLVGSGGESQARGDVLARRGQRSSCYTIARGSRLRPESRRQ